MTSAVPKEGKSTTSIGLAVLSAMAGHKTCLIDFDFRRPSLSTYTGLEPNADLPAYLMGKTDGFMVQNLEVEQSRMAAWTWLQARQRGSPLPTKHLASGRIQSLIAELREEYDMVIIDTAPVLAVAETQAIARYCDATVFCVARELRRASIDKAGLRKPAVRRRYARASPNDRHDLQPWWAQQILLRLPSLTRPKHSGPRTEPGRVQDGGDNSSALRRQRPSSAETAAPMHGG